MLLCCCPTRSGLKSLVLQTDVITRLFTDFATILYAKLLGSLVAMFGLGLGLLRLILHVCVCVCN